MWRREMCHTGDISVLLETDWLVAKVLKHSCRGEQDCKKKRRNSMDTAAVGRQDTVRFGKVELQ